MCMTLLHKPLNLSDAWHLSKIYRKGLLKQLTYEMLDKGCTVSPGWRASAILRLITAKSFEDNVSSTSSSAYCFKCFAARVVSTSALSNQASYVIQNTIRKIEIMKKLHWWTVLLSTPWHFRLCILHNFHLHQNNLLPFPVLGWKAPW